MLKIGGVEVLVLEGAALSAIGSNKQRSSCPGFLISQFGGQEWLGEGRQQNGAGVARSQRSQIGAPTTNLSFADQGILRVSISLGQYYPNHEIGDSTMSRALA